MGTELAAPGSSPEEDERLAAEIYDSVGFIRSGAKEAGISNIEVQDPSRACEIIALICRGQSERAIMQELGVGQKTLVRLKKQHSEVIETTRAYRSLKSTTLQLLAADALELKLRDVIEDDEVRAKTTVKDLSMGYGITTDKQRLIHGENTVVVHEHKVTLEDARAAIEAAQREVEGEVVEI